MKPIKLIREKINPIETIETIDTKLDCNFIKLMEIETELALIKEELKKNIRNGRIKLVIIFVLLLLTLYEVDLKYIDVFMKLFSIIN